MTSFIGYNNILETGTVTASSEAASHPKENAFDWFPHDWWQATGPGQAFLTVDMGANAAVDYWALAFHNIHDYSGSIQAQYSSDNFVSDINDLDTVQYPADGVAVMRNVTQQNVRYYRFHVVTTGSPAHIGALAMGARLELPGHVPLPFGSPVLSRDDKVLNNASDTGNFLGSSVLSAGYEFMIQQKQITTAWVDSNWDAFADHARTKPFFYVWDQEDRPTEVIFAKATDITYPKRNVPNRDDFSLKCKGLRE